MSEPVEMLVRGEVTLPAYTMLMNGCTAALVSRSKRRMDSATVRCQKLVVVVPPKSAPLIAVANALYAILSSGPNGPNDGMEQPDVGASRAAPIVSASNRDERRVGFKDMVCSRTPVWGVDSVIQQLGIGRGGGEAEG